MSFGKELSAMKRYSLFLLLSICCGAILLMPADELFSQRGMKISVRTKTGKALPLYTNSYALVVGNGNYTIGVNLAIFTVFL